jgi:transcriptional regulator with XRE-family HTH domain
MTKTGELIRKYREKRGLSQAYLSEKFDLTSAQFFSNIERGISSLPPEYVKRLSLILQVPLSRFTWAYKRDLEVDMDEKYRVYVKRARG